jgi:integrase
MAHGSYLFQRDGSKNWWIKLRSGGKRIERSLRTADRLEAEAAAAELIGEHKARLLAARPRWEEAWVHALEPGREHVGPDGSRVLATDKELFYIGDNGAIVKSEPNGGRAAQRVINNEAVGAPARTMGVLLFSADRSPSARQTAPVKKSGDDAILEVYLKQNGIIGHFENEARNVWALYRTLTEGKPLRDADRDDGRKLVAHFDAKGLRTATIRKKIAWLNAAVNLAIKESKLKFNPFSAIVPEREDATERKPLSDADIRACKRNLGALGEADQLLLRLLATTGMRLSEAFEIDGEQPKEMGVRFVIVGHKTKQSKRRVPLPSAALPFLPKMIKAPLFTGSIPAASKRLNRFLDDCGIVDSGKVLHSLRHRAQDRLRAAGCPLDVREELLGHEKVTVGKNYGIGSPVPMLKQWIDRIGF